jgi:hypothetical protein
MWAQKADSSESVQEVDAVQGSLQSGSRRTTLRKGPSVWQRRAPGHLEHLGEAVRMEIRLPDTKENKSMHVSDFG